MVGVSGVALLVLCWLFGLNARFSLACSDDWCSCSVQITVDPDSTSPCDTAVRNSTCNSFQDVLNSVAEVSGYTGDDCIAVRLLPGTHTLTNSVRVTQNLALWGSGAPPPSSPSPSEAPSPDQVITPYHHLLSPLPSCVAITYIHLEYGLSVSS